MARQVKQLVLIRLEALPGSSKAQAGSTGAPRRPSNGRAQLLERIRKAADIYYEPGAGENGRVDIGLTDPMACAVG